jgi:hypothetical protein
MINDDVTCTYAGNLFAIFISYNINKVILCQRNNNNNHHVNSELLISFYGIYLKCKLYRNSKMKSKEKICQ